MPKNRKKTYSDHQSEASREKKQPPKKKSAQPDANQVGARIVEESTKS